MRVQKETAMKPYRPTVTCNVNSDVNDKVTELANQRKVSRSRIMEDAINAYLKTEYKDVTHKDTTYKDGTRAK